MGRGDPLLDRQSVKHGLGCMAIVDDVPDAATAIDLWSLPPVFHRHLDVETRRRGRTGADESDHGSLAAVCCGVVDPDTNPGRGDGRPNAVDHCH
jgi:hypothetical protein